MNFAVAGNRLIGKLVEEEGPAAMPDAAAAAIAIVGLGRVGAALAAAFARTGPVIGFDIDEARVAALAAGNDAAGQCSSEELARPGLTFTCAPDEIAQADVVIVAVPVKTRGDRQADDRALLAASRSVGAHMKRGAVIVYECTVAPGTTETLCVAEIERVSGRRLHVDFHVGYSPECPGFGAPARRAGDIRKIVAGSSPAATSFLARLYGRIVDTGLFEANSIRVAEAAKILENVQRDVNIALVNELMLLFDAMDVRVSDVLAAAGSKWNFHHYFPGLVGGRSVSVDPCHLVRAGRAHGLAMDVVAAARAVNERTAGFIADKLHSMLAPEARDLRGFRVLVLGRSFKDDCPDTRNSKSFAVIDSLWNRGADVYSYDPVARDGDFEGGRGAVIVECLEDFAPYDAVVVTAGHEAFRNELDVFRLAAIAPRRAPVVDLRRLFDPELARLHFNYWTA